jgi:hypothetical protein
MLRNLVWAINNLLSSIIFTHKLLSLPSYLLISFIFVPDVTVLYIRGWMQMVFYCHMIYSPETKQNKMVRYLNMVPWTLLLFTYKWYYLQWSHTLCTVGPSCHTGRFLQSSWLLHESVAPSSAADKLLILPPTWRAGPTSIPPPGLTPFPSGFRHLPA